MFRSKSDVICTLILMGDIFAFVDSYFQPDIADIQNIFCCFYTDELFQIFTFTYILV